MGHHCSPSCSADFGKTVSGINKYYLRRRHKKRTNQCVFYYRLCDKFIGCKAEDGWTTPKNCLCNIPRKTESYGLDQMSKNCRCNIPLNYFLFPILCLSKNCLCNIPQFDALFSRKFFPKNCLCNIPLSFSVCSHKL